MSGGVGVGGGGSGGVEQWIASRRSIHYKDCFWSCSSFFASSPTFTYCSGSKPGLFQSFCVWFGALLLPLFCVSTLGVSLLLFSFNVPEVGAVFCCEFVKRDAESRFFARVSLFFAIFFFACFAEFCFLVEFGGAALGFWCYRMLCADAVHVCSHLNMESTASLPVDFTAAGWKPSSLLSGSITGHCFSQFPARSHLNLQPH